MTAKVETHIYGVVNEESGIEIAHRIGDMITFQVDNEDQTDSFTAAMDVDECRALVDALTALLEMKEPPK